MIRMKRQVKLLNAPEWRDEVLRRLEKIGPDTPHLWGSMNAGQMVCHVRDAFEGAMGERPIGRSGFSLWPLVKNLVLYTPRPWPHGVKTRPEVDQMIGGTPPVEFRSDMEKLLAAIDRFTAVPRAFTFQRHPMFGAMSERDWMCWGYRHIDHHLRQFGV